MDTWVEAVAEREKTRWVRLGGVILFFALVLMIPLRIAGTGYLPPDDALRYAAFAVDHRQWSDVVVFRPDIRADMDQHPGWQAIVDFFHRVGGLEPDGLVVLSYTITFCIVALAGLMGGASPLAWLVTLGIGSVLLPEIFARALSGRPTAVSTAAVIVLMFVWTRSRTGLRRHFLLTFVTLTIAVYAHPSAWYLWFMPAVLVGVTGGWRSSALFVGAIFGAVALAATLSGSFYDVVVYPLHHLAISLFGPDPGFVTNLVTEFQPAPASRYGLIVVAFALVWRRVSGIDRHDNLWKPDFLLAVAGWILGMFVLRFWVDWGAPALLVWVCRQIALQLEERRLPWRGVLSIAGGAALVFLFSVSSDFEARYTRAGRRLWLTIPAEQLAKALPDDGGVLYTTDMAFFYDSYFREPHRKFRYITGFEPGMMPVEDEKISTRILLDEDQLIEPYLPWVEKMTPRDRIFIRSAQKPNLDALDLTPFYAGYWIGRLKPAAAAHP